jgi:hypothetical protein
LRPWVPKSPVFPHPLLRSNLYYLSFQLFPQLPWDLVLLYPLNL